MNKSQIHDDVQEKISQLVADLYKKSKLDLVSVRGYFEDAYCLAMPEIKRLKSENEILKAYVSELEKQQAFPEDISNAIIKQFAYSGDVHYSIIEAMENRIAGAEWLWAEICSREIYRLKIELEVAKFEIQKLKEQIEFNKIS